MFLQCVLSVNTRRLHAYSNSMAVKQMTTEDKCHNLHGGWERIAVGRFQKGDGYNTRQRWVLDPDETSTLSRFPNLGNVAQESIANICVTTNSPVSSTSPLQNNGFLAA
jgi:hypothetical protein